MSRSYAKSLAGGPGGSTDGTVEIGLAWKHENVFIDTSAHLPRYYPAQLIQFMKTYGRSKVLFGTNYPQLPLQKCVEQAKALELPEGCARAFFSANARSVFKI